MDHAETTRILTRALGVATGPPSFLPLVDGIRDALRSMGIRVDRVQLPLSHAMGFRHPTLGLVLATWEHDTGHAQSEVLTHAFLDGLDNRGAVNTPFEDIVLRGAPHLLVPDLAQEDLGIPMLAKLRRRGFRGYLALGLPTPDGNNQPLSLASRATYSPELLQRVAPIRDLLGLAVYAAYRTSQAVRLAETYIGHDSGARVLAGDIRRGSTRRLEAGIMFCDIRGFTALTERLGAEGVVRLVNDVFARVGREAEARGGEILKFIGDAMLMVFPVDGDRAEVAQAMVSTSQASLESTTALEGDVHVGFGGHIGEIVQANIGTPQRLDFTVMGAAVNLASRLESLCKPLRADAVFSSVVAAEAGGDLQHAGHHAVKGVAEPVAAFVLRS